MNIDIFTINMAGNNGNVAERYGELNKFVQSNKPHILTAQEVSADVGATALEEIARELGEEYSLEYETTTQSKKGRHGLAILSKLPMTGKNTVEFSVPGKKALVSELLTDDEDSLIVANVHLDAHPRKGKNRRIKLRELTQSLESDFPDNPTIIAGDFNSMPFYPCLRTLKNNGYMRVPMPSNGSSLKYTFPSSLTADELIQHSFMREDQVRLLRRIAWLPGVERSPHSGIPRYIIDHIFHTRDIKALSAKIIEKAHAKAPPFSDHCGIQATLKIA